MTEIEKKALVFVNEVRTDRGWSLNLTLSEHDCSRTEALCRAIEQHEAFKRDVSDAIELNWSGSNFGPPEHLARFILPKPVDPLVEALDAVNPDVSHGEGDAELFRKALAARGLKIVEDKP